MSFPWQTEKQRRKQQEDEEAAIREVANFHYRQFVKGINRATDVEINEAMAEILRKQSQRNVLRPGKRRSA